jgi:hypothetical protein
MFYKILNLMQYNSKWNIVFIIILILLYNNGYVTEYRILIFSIIILLICLYKKLYKKVKELDFTYRENVLYVILWIDYIKLSLINMLIFFSIEIYELKIIYKNNKIIKSSILMFENLTTNPIKMILHKFYNVLNVWKTTSILEIFFKRIYGSVLGILIFSNVIGYVWYVLNYSWLNVYILILVINLIDEIVRNQKFMDYKIYKFLEYIKYLNLNKNLCKIITLRSDVSIFVLYIKKSIQRSNLGYRKNKMKTFAFFFNIIYEFNIINLRIQIKKYKLYEHKFIFQVFYIDIINCLNNYFRLLGSAEYILIKIKKDPNFAYQFTEIDVLKLKLFVLLVIKLLLYYLWDFEGANNNLNINQISTIYELDFVLIDKAILISNINKVNNIFFDVTKNVEFYNEFYLYAKMFSNYDLNNNIVMSTLTIDFGIYENLELYAIKMLNQMLVIYNLYEIDIEFCRANEEDSIIEDEILSQLYEYRNNFMEEWQESQKESLEYRNVRRLRELNEYIFLQIK